MRTAAAQLLCALHGAGLWGQVLGFGQEGDPAQGDARRMHRQRKIAAREAQHHAIRAGTLPGAPTAVCAIRPPDLPGRRRRR